MSRKRKKIALILLILGLMSGFMVLFVDLGWTLFLPLAWGLFALGSFLVLLMGLRNDKEAVFFGLSALVGYVVFIAVGFGYTAYQRASVHQTALELVKDLTTYQAKQGEYPATLTELDKRYKLPQLEYHRDSTKQNYSLSYVAEQSNWGGNILEGYSSYNQMWHASDAK